MTLDLCRKLSLGQLSYPATGAPCCIWIQQLQRDNAMLVHIAHYALHMGIKAYSRCILGLSKYICPQDNDAECMQYVSMKNGTKMDNRS